jgi:hypothetical protein
MVNLSHSTDYQPLIIPYQCENCIHYASGLQPGYARTSYINHNETQEPLEPWTSSDPSTREDSSLHWGGGMPETSSVISLTGQNHSVDKIYLII